MGWCRGFLIVLLVGGMVAASCDSDGDSSSTVDVSTRGGESTTSLTAGLGGEGGGFTTHVPSEAAPGTGIAIRVFYPGVDMARYDEGAPVVLVLPGGWDTGSLLGETMTRLETDNGFVSIEMLLPGGSELDGTTSGGVEDTRGKDSVQAVVDVLEYASGSRPDIDGRSIHDRIDYALTENLGIHAYSHGGNLAIAALAEIDPSRAQVRWLVTNESPVGDQQAMGELNRNPFFEPGTCEGTTCPWPGLGEALEFDPEGTSKSITGGPSWPGRFSATLEEGSGGTVPFLVAPGPPENPDRAFMSVELVTDIWANQDRLFNGEGPPEWLPTIDEAIAYWHWRDGSVRIAEASAKHPDLLVCVVQQQTDHLQTSPDYPHTWMNIEAWANAGHAFYRLNPDATYTAAVTGQDAELLPDSDAGSPVPWPDARSAMLPNGLYLGPYAAVFEMADRTQTNNQSPNLDATINN